MLTLYFDTRDGALALALAFAHANQFPLHILHIPRWQTYRAISRQLSNQPNSNTNNTHSLALSLEILVCLHHLMCQSLMNKWSRLIFIRVTYTKLNRKIHSMHVLVWIGGVKSIHPFVRFTSAIGISLQLNKSKHFVHHFTAFDQHKKCYTAIYFVLMRFFLYSSFWPLCFRSFISSLSRFVYSRVQSNPITTMIKHALQRNTEHTSVCV